MTEEQETGNIEERTSTAVAVIRGGILILSFVIIILVLFQPPWFGPHFKEFLLWLPYRKVLLPIFFLFGYPLLLALISLGVGQVPFTPIGLVHALIMATVDLYTDLLLVFLILFPVAIQVFIWLTVVFFGAMTIAGFTWGYRWLTGTFQPVFNRETVFLLLIYLAILAFLLVVVFFSDRLLAKQEAYVDFVHNLRRKALMKAASLTKPR